METQKRARIVGVQNEAQENVSSKPPMARHHLAAAVPTNEAANYERNVVDANVHGVPRIAVVSKSKTAICISETYVASAPKEVYLASAVLTVRVVVENVAAACGMALPAAILAPAVSRLGEAKRSFVEITFGTWVATPAILSIVASISRIAKKEVAARVGLMGMAQAVKAANEVKTLADTEEAGKAVS